MKIKIEDLKNILETELIEDESSIEMNFSLENDKKYDDCWLGKMPNENNCGKELFWYGLVEDGNENYNYDNLEELLTANIFNGKNLKEIIKDVEWHSLDGCSIEERLIDYI